MHSQLTKKRSLLPKFLLLMVFLTTQLSLAGSFKGQKTSFDYSNNWEVVDHKAIGGSESVNVAIKDKKSSESVNILVMPYLQETQKSFDFRKSLSNYNSDKKVEFGASKNGNYGKHKAWITSSVTEVNGQKYRITMSSFNLENNHNVLVTEILKLNNENSAEMKKIRDSLKISFE